jgi:hypothetical protein
LRRRAYPARCGTGGGSGINCSCKAARKRRGLVVITIIDAAALALLGPGAYSLDALRFGRRVIFAESWRDGD